ncbi:D-alanyl-D-alanine carboxypeptidase/D-alanyl-D-alanine endopeptidase [Propionivibrio limicola]|uniref:D-alanyl-D-alanine carboxypeptidase/D-alanyl-D-alanine endopeptidase n=1 Tax=Propionivibrio limicola TaxID=167645 RepID=UPI0014794D1F|nr:D-alanyl-D-alanine carboxypeptidase/D-alanyl-D-alanine-endopeptidase [Propionivibrio limicola]
MQLKGKRGGACWLASLRCCRRFFGAGLLFAVPLAVLAAGLPPSVSAALRQAAIAEANVAVVVRPVEGGEALVEHNAMLAMNPASAMKLVTTYAALELLGPAFTWKTAVLADAPPKAGRVQGNLYLRGSGDPRLAQEQFWLLLRQLRARGVHDIDGDLVLDRRAFEVPPHDPAAFDGEPLRPYNAGPDALLVSLNSVRLTLHPDTGRKAVAVIAESPAEGLRIDNRLQPDAGACGDWREKINVAVSGGTLLLRGSFPLACGDKPLNLAPWSPDVHVERLFRALWGELGGRLRGRVRAGETPETALVVAEQASPPLADVVREINKFSNNVMARQVFLSLAQARPASAEAARVRVLGWLAEKGVEVPELVLDNGAGLSRSERISAEGLSRLLLAAWRSPVMPEFMSSLPLAGIDGTLAKRLGNGAASGRAHLKTGYLAGVRAIAGYVLDASGKRWGVVFLINDPKAIAGKPAMDALLEWVAGR